VTGKRFKSAVEYERTGNGGHVVSADTFPGGGPLRTGLVRIKIRTPSVVLRYSRTRYLFAFFRRSDMKNPLGAETNRPARLMSSARATTLVSRKPPLYSDTRV